MEQPNGSRALYEIQALITAQEMKSAHRSFVDLNHETLERQQKELNWERLRLKIPTGKKQLKALEVNNHNEIPQWSYSLVVTFWFKIVIALFDYEYFRESAG